MNFTWEVPTRIHFGTNICAEALSKEKEILFNRRALLVFTGHTLQDNGTLDKVKGLLEENGCAMVTTYGGHGSNPEICEAEEAGRIVRENKLNLIVGFGGGSAIDLAKGAAVAAASDISLSDYLVKGIPAPENLLPIIAMPTTAGTGSELSKGAILSDKNLAIKSGIRGKSQAPKVAIVDAAFTWSMPKQLTMETGFDALAHAIESYISLKANRHSENLSLQAIKIIGENLRKLNENLDDHEAREKMSYASMLMGMNLYNVGNCLPHRMQYPIGALTGTSHAAGLAALYPSWMKEEYKVCSEKIIRLFELLELNKPKDANDVKKIIKDFIMRIQIYEPLSGMGVETKDIGLMIQKIKGDLSSDAIAVKTDITEYIYLESLT
ncbi:alcohol dehydrogenase [Selenomonas ruminantium]|uniref:Alcohol dehydrogenase n=1 Tax=Selenomonas ruminantium TaxID=971 RepID=A0A1M6UL41_SELRU|nr:iron-containing alcohol dehydrogenase [Selenomonas ruminantium]SHK69850.1 alcohol dehydrogenase [Selenomonas ruminantium]